MNLNSNDLVYYGNDRSLIVESYGTLNTDYTGLATATAIYTTRRDQWSRFPNIYTKHPIFSFMLMSSRKVSIDGAFARAECEYGGFQADQNENGGFTPPVYELVVGMSEEPITVHPKFTTNIAGTPTAPLNGAVFINVKTKDVSTVITPTTNAGWRFYEWEYDSKYYGVERYLDAGNVTWRKTQNAYYTYTAISRAGTVETPEGPAPRLNQNRNWLNMGTTITRKGAAVQMVTEWRASGRRPWNSTIYG